MTGTTSKRSASTAAAADQHQSTSSASASSSHHDGSTTGIATGTTTGNTENNEAVVRRRRRSTRATTRPDNNDDRKPAVRSSRRIAAATAAAAAAPAAATETTASVFSTAAAAGGGSSSAASGPKKRKESDRHTASSDLTIDTATTGTSAASSAASSVRPHSSGKKTQHVTPSPAVDSSSTRQFAFETPPRKTRRGNNNNGDGAKVLTELLDGGTAEESRLPKGVVDMYCHTTRDLHDFRSFQFDDDEEEGKGRRRQPGTSATVHYDDRYVHSSLRCEANSSNSLSAEFIRSYGDEYLQSLKEKEAPAVPYPASPASKTHCRGTSPGLLGSSQSSGASGHSSHNHHNSDSSDGSSNSFDDEDLVTPHNRKSYIHPSTMLKMDGKVSRMVKTTNKQQGPVESNDFLMYQPDLTPKMRTILVDWLIELSDHFHFGEGTLHQAITLVDMVLACGPLGDDLDADARDYGEDDLEEEDDEDHEQDSSRLTTCYFVSRSRFQLLGAACTWMACKLLESNTPSLSDISYVSDHIYTARQIKRMERRVCNALGFRFLSQPTPYLFLHEFLRASEEMVHPSCYYEMSLNRVLSSASMPSSSSSSVTPSNTLASMACYLLELGRMPYAPATRPPSLLAASAVYLARVTLGLRSADRSKCPNGWWTPTMEYYTGYKKSQIRETVMEIHMYQAAAESSNLKALFIKYKSKKYHRVAFKTVPLRDDLGFERRSTITE